MKNMTLFLLLVLLSIISFAQQKVRFDDGWRFHRGDVSNGEQSSLNDADWRTVQLPHDWSIEDLPGTNSPFSPDAVNGVSQGFTTGGIGWYRKTFTMPASSQDKVVYILFDGVYMNADVWLNGEHLGNHPYGYTSFYYDITSKLKPGTQNVLAVQVKNEGATSRWYPGSGINRHVWLITKARHHIAQWGTYITTDNVTTKGATVHITTTVQNESAQATSIRLQTTILNSKGAQVSTTASEQTIQPNTSFDFSQNAAVQNPQLWSVDSPTLYKAVTKVFTGSKLTDSTTTTFGIRSIHFDAQTGFTLNGKPLKLKGGCYHIDNGPLGARAYDRAEERRAQLLKASGFNAIRCSHNPPAPAFLDACDKLGLLVVDETFDMWETGKNANDYHLYFKDWWQRDVESMLLRDRNHPSIILWSIGNEIPNMDNPGVVDTAHQLADFVHQHDPSRLITAAVNGLSEKKDPFFAALDISGYNYGKDFYEKDHQRHPERIMMATESYALQAFDYWMAVEDHPYVIGDFIWTAYDYIGEASIGWLGYWQKPDFYPWNLAYCGDIDICGWKRPQSYYRDVLWKKNQLSLFVKPPQPSFPLNPNKEAWSIWNWYDVVANWNWAGNEGKPLEVNVYSSCDAVELFLNGKSLGRQQTDRNNQFTAKFNVPYQPGTLKAVGYNGTQQVNTAELHTATAPVKIKLTADRRQIKANGEDLSYITVELLDANGHRNTTAENEVHFTIQGDGIIAGVGNANPISLESYQQPHRKAWQGRCLAVIKGGGKGGTITLTASSEGLPGSTITIEAVK